MLIAAAGAIASAAVIASAFALAGSGGRPAAVREIMPAMAAGVADRTRAGAAVWSGLIVGVWLGPSGSGPVWLRARLVWAPRARSSPRSGPAPAPDGPGTRARARDAAAAGQHVGRPGPGHDHRRHPAAAAGQGSRHTEELLRRSRSTPVAGGDRRRRPGTRATGFGRRLFRSAGRHGQSGPGQRPVIRGSPRSVAARPGALADVGVSVGPGDGHRAVAMGRPHRGRPPRSPTAPAPPPSS